MQPFELLQLKTHECHDNVCGVTPRGVNRGRFCSWIGRISEVKQHSLRTLLTLMHQDTQPSAAEPVVN